MWAAADSLFYYIDWRLPIVHRLGEFVSQSHRKCALSKLSAYRSRFILFVLFIYFLIKLTDWKWLQVLDSVLSLLQINDIFDAVYYGSWWFTVIPDQCIAHKLLTDSVERRHKVLEKLYNSATFVKNNKQEIKIEKIDILFYFLIKTPLFIYIYRFHDGWDRWWRRLKAEAETCYHVLSILLNRI